MKSSYRFLVFAILLIAISVVGYSTPTITEKTEAKFDVHQMDVSLENVVVNDLFVLNSLDDYLIIENGNNKSMSAFIYISDVGHNIISTKVNDFYSYTNKINYNSTYKKVRDLPNVDILRYIS